MFARKALEQSNNANVNIRVPGKLQIGQANLNLKQNLIRSKSSAFNKINLKQNDENTAVPVKLGSKGQLQSKIPVSKIPIPCKSSVAEKRPEAKPLQKNVLGQRERAAPNQLVNAVRKLQISHPTPTIVDIDKVHNCHMMSEFSVDIYRYLCELETRWRLPTYFLREKNPTFSPEHRSVLINWLLTVHCNYNLLPETIYITVGILDRFLSMESVTKNEYQLTGIAALFIASKFEEIYFPDLNDFLAVCDNLYNKKQLCQMESRILRVLKFDIGRPYSLQFLRRCSKAANAPSKVHMIGKYICELMLTNYEVSSWKPSLIAATALYLALRLNTINGDSPPSQDAIWTPTLEHYSFYKRSEVLVGLPTMADYILKADASRSLFCRSKYSESKYMCINKFNPHCIQFLKKLAATSSP